MSILVLCILLMGCLKAEAKLTYSDSTARKILEDEGIAVNKPSPATSLEDIRQSTIEGIVALKRESGIDITITGGTEGGHAKGPMSHSNGYKLDIRPTAEINNYIKDNFESVGKRSDGAAMYKDEAGNTYAREHNHWDIVFPDDEKK